MGPKRPTCALTEIRILVRRPPANVFCPNCDGELGHDPNLPPGEFRFRVHLCEDCAWSCLLGDEPERRER